MAASGSKLRLEVRRMIHGSLQDRNMFWRLARIFSIGVDLRPVRAAAQEGERQIQGASVPISHAAQIPLFTVTASDGDVLARYAIEDPSFIPSCRNRLDEIERRLVFVTAGLSGII